MHFIILSQEQLLANSENENMSNSLSEDKSVVLYPTPPESLVDHTVLGKYTVFVFSSV